MKKVFGILLILISAIILLIDLFSILGLVGSTLQNNHSTNWATFLGGLSAAVFILIVAILLLWWGVKLLRK